MQLVHVPLSEYPNNVYVYNIELNRILGFLDSGLAAKLVGAFGEGFCLDGEIRQITGSEYNLYGCNLCIFDCMKFMREELEKE